MYKDIADTIHGQKDVEQKLSVLESHVAGILHKVKKAQESGEAGLWLTRVEQTKLRKFFFIMQYRGPSFYRKYFPEGLQTYDSEDVDLLMIYMAERGMPRPRDVWLHNLHTILDLDMDANNEWTTRLPEIMFPGDAQMFIFHCMWSYMAFCTPDHKQDEFILTDECYNVFEGPTNETFCAKTGDFLGNTYQCYHEFVPVSPRLIIVPRSLCLPEALEDRDPQTQKARERRRQAAVVQFPEPERAATSILSDLPVAKARNSYTIVVNGRLELAPNASERRRADDRFCFQLFPISTRHVDTINSIFLDNILPCKSIVYGSKRSFKRTLEVYMTDSTHVFKTIGTTPYQEYRAQISRRACLEKLSTVLMMFGSKSVPVWSNIETDKTYTRSFDDMWLDTMKVPFDSDADACFSTSETGSFSQAYNKLGITTPKSFYEHWVHTNNQYVPGGTRALFMKDMDQAWRLYKLGAPVFTLTERFDNDAVRRQAHVNPLKFIVQSHPRRVWLYVKHRRWIQSDEYAMHQVFYVGTAPLFAAKTKAMFRAEIEDKVAINCMCSVMSTIVRLWDIDAA